VRSLRAHVLVGAFLWTLGLFAIITIVLTFSLPAMRSVVIIHAHSHLSAVAALICLAAGLTVVRSGLTPFADMRRKLAEVRRGERERVDGPYPSEVQPLVDDLNALLSHTQQAVARATAKAGDLAHGLKTPLAVLSNEGERLEAHGQAELGAMIAQQVALMRRQVEYHLAHARAAASGAAVHARCAVAPSVDGLIRTLLRLHAQRGLRLESSVDPSHTVRGTREDLDEMLGNLLDNACKWASTRVQVGSTIHDGRLHVTVDDDGPGIDPSARAAVLQRGVRADEATPGSGLGLAIVRDLADLYGGAIAMESSPLGGLRARLELPAG
jgi:signal transduction histidine kinase